MSVERREGSGPGGERRRGRRVRPGLPEAAARAVRLVLFDVDGVFTDAGVYLGEDGGGSSVELKRFDIQDGLGVRLLQESGLIVALVSGRVSPATAARARELGVAECHQDPDAQKIPLVEGILERHGVAWSEVAMLGDDLPDLPVLRRVGLPVAVRNAVPEVREETVWRTRRMGGRGAVREFARELLLVRGEWERAVDRYLAERSNG